MPRPKTKIYGQCRHCGRGKNPIALTNRGLCQVCNGYEDIRAMYPTQFELDAIARGETIEQAYVRRYEAVTGQRAEAKRDKAESKRRSKAQAYRVGSWGLTRDVFDDGRFADGMPGNSVMICPMG